MILRVSELSPPLYIDSVKRLERWLESVRDSRVIAVDTESDSFYSYREKVCLIQMTAAEEDVLIDPLAVDDLSCLGPVFADPDRVKIFHDAGYDLACLMRDYEFEFAGLFDTMLASRMLGIRKFGLAAILKERFDCEASKEHQRSDWGRRPLSPGQIQYARYDTHFLPRIYEHLVEELDAANRLVWAEEEFSRLPKLIQPASRMVAPDRDAFWRVKGAKHLGPEPLGRIRELYKARDKIAQRLDRPPFKVFSDLAMVALAEDPPASLRELRPVRGLGQAAIARFGRDIIEALGIAQPVNGKAPPGSGRRRRTGRFLDPDARDRYEALRDLRRVKADDLGLEPEVLLGNATLETLARNPPKQSGDLVAAPEFSGWRGPLLVDAIVDLLK
jgi:ribonuclease D